MASLLQREETNCERAKETRKERERDTHSHTVTRERERERERDQIKALYSNSFSLEERPGQGYKTQSHLNIAQVVPFVGKQRE